MKTRLTSLLLSTPLLITAAACFGQFAGFKFGGLGWQDGN